MADLNVYPKGLSQTYNVKSSDIISFLELNGSEMQVEEIKVPIEAPESEEQAVILLEPADLKRQATRTIETIKLHLDSFSMKIACVKQKFDDQIQQENFLAKLKILENLKKMTETLLQKEPPSVLPPSNPPSYQEIKDNDKLFIGFFEKKSFTGFSTVKREDRTYVGTINNKMFEGYGAMIYNSGSFFIGNWVNGLKEGFGRYIGCDGAEYTGNFKNDKMDGDAIVKYANGDIFQGEFKDGRQNGMGKYSFKSSDFWEFDEGLWENGKLQKLIKYRRVSDAKKEKKDKKEEKKEKEQKEQKDKAS
jgi:hypothetical protein